MDWTIWEHKIDETVWTPRAANIENRWPVAFVRNEYFSEVYGGK